MILVTVGTQLPFDRLIKAIDEIYPELAQKVVVQAGKSTISPRNFKIQDSFSRDEFEDTFQQADIIVAHAGMGTILTALKYNKKIIIFPRLSQYKEHRNNHQLATAEYMQQLPNVFVANTEQELLECLIKIKDLSLNNTVKTKNRDEFIAKLSTYINQVVN